MPFFIAEWIPQTKYTENVNGGSLAWNPPFFAGCYFTAPFLILQKKIDIIIVLGNKKGFTWGDKPPITPIGGKKFFYPETYPPPLDRTY